MGIAKGIIIASMNDTSNIDDRAFDSEVEMLHHFLLEHLKHRSTRYQLCVLRCLVVSLETGHDRLTYAKEQRQSLPLSPRAHLPARKQAQPQPQIVSAASAVVALTVPDPSAVTTAPSRQVKRRGARRSNSRASKPEPEDEHEFEPDPLDWYWSPSPPRRRRLT